MGKCQRCGALNTIRPIKVMDGGNPGHIITVTACTRCNAIQQPEQEQ